MNIDKSHQNDLLIITVNEARIDASVAIQFKDKVRELSQDGPNRIILDLHQVDFIDSSGLGAIVAVMKLQGDARRLELAALTPPVRKVFRMTRMDTIFKIHDSLEMLHNP